MGYRRLNKEQKTALAEMLKSPWYNWETACGVKRPVKKSWLQWLQIWKIYKILLFKKLVGITKEAIENQLRHNEDYVPGVSAELVNGMWEIRVHVWGDPIEEAKHRLRTGKR